MRIVIGLLLVTSLSGCGPAGKGFAIGLLSGLTPAEQRLDYYAMIRRLCVLS